MKHHIALPTLQLAAAAFLTASATPIDSKYCVKADTNTVVAIDKCVGDHKGFSLVEGPPDVKFGPGLPPATETKKEELETGGFGRRGTECDDPQCSGGS